MSLFKYFFQLTIYYISLAFDQFQYKFFDGKGGVRCSFYFCNPILFSIKTVQLSKYSNVHINLSYIQY
ncbi:Hypothetical protein SRAE_X000068200 [Strongyloides ratti]|uniref:Uncharacterized protein n=1 Tax=Strongyloides ratti TaxID=34506 RepID=A0A090LNB7_STRRB|nr:Hypothetical protein SRAE_X000068200 [Strongyloides ratti]CEF71355.1 Hypothetical protein SRAE_X000068200 [Strongyloides ratti]